MMAAKIAQCPRDLKPKRIKRSKRQVEKFERCGTHSGVCFPNYKRSPSEGERNLQDERFACPSLSCHSERTEESLVISGSRKKQ